MDFAAKARSLASLIEFAATPGCIRGSKPVLMCGGGLRRTGSPEAEVPSTRTTRSDTVWLKFPIVALPTGGNRYHDLTRTDNHAFALKRVRKTQPRSSSCDDTGTPLRPIEHRLQSELCTPTDEVRRRADGNWSKPG